MNVKNICLHLLTSASLTSIPLWHYCNHGLIVQNFATCCVGNSPILIMPFSALPLTLPPLPLPFLLSRFPFSPFPLFPFPFLFPFPLFLPLTLFRVDPYSGYQLYTFRHDWAQMCNVPIPIYEYENWIYKGRNFI